MTGTYDVHVPKPVDDRTGWVELAAGLSEARAVAADVLRRGGVAYVVRSAYRWPRIDRDAARGIAEAQRRELVAAGLPLEPFSAEIDDSHWWTFVAEDLEAQARGVAPGVREIAVDKLTGRLRTDEDVAQWLALTFPT